MFSNRRWLLYLFLLLTVALAACTGQTELPETGSDETALPPQVVLEAQERLAQVLGIQPADIGVRSIEQRQFSDACLGLAEPGELCAQVIVEGWLVDAVVNGEPYEIRVSNDGQTVRWQQTVSNGADGEPQGLTAPQSAAEGEVSIYLVSPSTALDNPEAIGCGDRLVGIPLAITAEESTLEGALRTLFMLGQNYNSEAGLYNALQNSQLEVDNVTLDQGTATIHLSGELSIGGECDNPRVEAQIRETALQFPGVQNVEIFLNGEPLASVLSTRGE